MTGYPLIIRVHNEEVGRAYGSVNWFRSREFLRIPALPSWITEAAWDSLLSAGKRLDAADLDARDRRGLEPSLHDIARGTTGCGEDFSMANWGDPYLADDEDYYYTVDEDARVGIDWASLAVITTMFLVLLLIGLIASWHSL